MFSLQLQSDFSAAYGKETEELKNFKRFNWILQKALKTKSNDAEFKKIIKYIAGTKNLGEYRFLRQC
jgi:hypothetical protein